VYLTEYPELKKKSDIATLTVNASDPKQIDVDVSDKDVKTDVDESKGSGEFKETVPDFNNSDKNKSVDESKGGDFKNVGVDF
jgi:hypothetical protein